MSVTDEPQLVEQIAECARLALDARIAADSNGSIDISDRIDELRRECTKMLDYIVERREHLRTHDVFA